MLKFKVYSKLCEMERIDGFLWEMPKMKKLAKDWVSIILTISQASEWLKNGIYKSYGEVKWLN